MKSGRPINFKTLGLVMMLVSVTTLFACASKTPEDQSKVTISGGGESETPPGQGVPQGGPNVGSNVPPPTINNLPTPSKCETNPSLKSNPLCQIVLTGYSGDLHFLNNPAAHGYLKNDYFLDGRLHGTTWYPSKTTTQPVMTTVFQYNSDGTIQTIDTTADTNNDGAMDLKSSLVNTYQSGKLSKTEITFTGLPSNAVLGKNVTGYSYMNAQNPLPSGWVPNATVAEYKFTGEYTTANSPALNVPNVVTYEINFLNSDNVPVESRSLRVENPWNGTPMYQKSESVESFQYNNDKTLAGSVKNLYDCSKSTPTPNMCFGGSYLEVVAGLNPYGQFNTTWTYDNEGRLSHGETTVQGDVLDPNGPNHGILNQTNPYKWQCNVAYDTANQKVIAKFPDIFKFIGLSETDKVQSLTCDDFGRVPSLMGVNFIFDEWSYLWQATGQPEPQ